MLKARYGDVKIYITENGLGDEDIIIDGEIVDIPRIKFIEEHLVAVKNAIKEGINLGTRKSFADIGATVADILNVSKTKNGTSFKEEVMK